MSDIFSAVLEAKCEAFAPRVLSYDGSGQPVSFAQFFGTVLAFAERLGDAGVGEGSPVTVGIRDAIAAMAARAALMRLGAVVLPDYAGAILARDGIEVALALRDRLPDTPGTRDLLVDGSWITNPTRIVPISGKGLFVRGTSGTTGTPKLRAAEEDEFLARLLRGMARRSMPQGAAHIAYSNTSTPGSNLFLRMVLTGRTHLHELDSPADSLAQMRRCAATAIYASPFNFKRLLSAVEQGEAAPEGLELVIVGGGGVAPDLAQRAEVAFGCPLRNTYGSSETGSIADHRPASRPDLPGAVGRVYEDLEYELRDEAGAPVAPGAEGELFLKVDHVSAVRDYPAMTRLWDGGGWLGTGDIGRLTEDGILCLTGRRSEFLNVGGTKRAPSYFEALAGALPGVVDVLAFAAPDRDGTDQVGLAVVGGPGFDLAQFARQLGERLGPRFPLQIAPVAEIPVTDAGKPDRKCLSDAFRAHQARQVEHHA